MASSLPAQAVFEPAPAPYPSGRLYEGQLLGSRCRWWVYGQEEADPLLLIHGFRGDHHGLELIAAGLADYCLYIPDLPSFGRSEPLEGIQHSISSYASWILAFIDQVIRQPVHLVGHSFGSIISSYAALARPQLVSQLSLINPICQPALEGDQRLASLLAQAYYGLGALLPGRLGFALLRSPLITRLTSEFMMKTPDPALRSFINGQHLAYFGAFSNRQALLETYQASISHTAADYTPALPQPVQLLAAERDDLGSLDLQKKMASQLQLGRLDIIPEVGHLIHYETPLRAAALIADFHQEYSS